MSLSRGERFTIGLGRNLEFYMLLNSLPNAHHGQRMLQWFNTLANEGNEPGDTQDTWPDRQADLEYETAIREWDESGERARTMWARQEPDEDVTLGSGWGPGEVTVWAATAEFADETHIHSGVTLVTREGREESIVGLADIFIRVEGYHVANIEGEWRDIITIPFPVSLSEAQHWPQRTIRSIRMEELPLWDRYYFEVFDKVMNAFGMRGALPVEHEVDLSWTVFTSRVINICRDASVPPDVRLGRVVEHLLPFILDRENTSEGHLGDEDDDSLPDLTTDTDGMSM